MHKFYSSILCFGLILSLPAQTIQSTVLDFNTREPIPFVNIGILGKNHGTVSDAHGHFTLDIPQTEIAPNDTLRFSSIGYQKLDFLVKDLATLPKEIKLQKTTLLLPTVTINPKKYKRLKTLGHRANSDKIVFYFQSNRLGTELASLIEVKKGSYYLKSAHFNIAENKFGALFFRINLYESLNGLPGKNLLPEGIIVKTDLKKGTLSVDLARYNLVLAEDFILSLEWVQALNQGKLSKDLMFCAALGNGTIFTKTTSQANWRAFTQKKFGFRPQLGFYVEGVAE